MSILTPRINNIEGSSKKIGWDHTVGGSFAIGANHIHISPAIATSDITISKLSIFMGTNAAGRVLTLGIYNSVAGLPVTKLAQTSELVVTATTTGLFYLNLQSPVELAADTEYFLVIHSNNGVTVETAFNNVSSGKQKYYNIAYNATLPASLGAPTADSGGHPSIGGY
jgi:hypothetical protein